MKYFLHENKLLEQQIDCFFSRLSEYNNDFCEGKLSVILLGSLSRGEGTWIEQNGKNVMLSDIEFFTVYFDMFNDFDGFESYIQATAQELFNDSGSSLFHVDNTFITGSQLTKLEKKLIIYDAINFGKCVVGRNVMDKFPKIDINNINLYDIKDILTHRAFSVLYYGFPLKNTENYEQYRYSLAKNSLDLMTVLLVEHGMLESGFINRFNRIKELDFSQNLKDYFSYCLAIKLGEKNNMEYSIEEMEDIFISIVKNARKNFKVSPQNTAKNLKHIIKRQLGIVKRSLKYRHVVFGNHLSRLLVRLETRQNITEREKKDNFVLNGYPTME